MKQKKRTVFAVATIVSAPLIVLLLMEGILTISGYRSPFEDEDPYLGFSANSPLFERIKSHGRTVYATRARKLRWFNPQEFLAAKPANGYRVFCLGGSTTFGRPYADSTSFAGWLRVLLRAEDPTHTYEVINAGGVSYASYRVVNVMKEAAAYEPDLFVVYTGHNEFLEERTYGTIRSEPGLITGMRTTLQGLKTYGLVRDLIAPLRDGAAAEAKEKFRMTGEVNAILDHSAGVERYQRDTVQAGFILNHFRNNLNRMVDIARSCGAGLIFVVPSSNEKDFSPFKSAFSRNLSQDQKRSWNREYESGLSYLKDGKPLEALPLFEDLTQIDPEYADVRFRAGTALFDVARYAEAKQEFITARDQDIAPLRATSAIQEAVRSVASERDIPLCDLQILLEDRLQAEASHRCLGNEFFYDHCHPTIEVHQYLAQRIRDIIVRSAPSLANVEWLPVNEDQIFSGVLSSLSPRYYGLRDLNLAKVLRWAGKKAEASLFVRRAARELPDHPEALYLLGLTLQEQGAADSAAPVLRKSIALDPSNAGAYNALGSLYLRTGRADEAIHLFHEAIARNPDLEGVQYNLGNALVRTGDAAGAVEAYQAELRLDPEHIMALNNLGFVYLNQRRFDLAKPLFERTIALDPENIEAFSNLGIIAFMEGDLDQAGTMFRKVSAIDPDDAFAREWLDRIQDARKGEGGR